MRSVKLDIFAVQILSVKKLHNVRTQAVISKDT